jgi:DNA-binding CsgD family transcriptional regulator
VWNGFDRDTGAVAALGDPPELYGPEDAELTLGLDDHPMMKAYLNGGPALSTAPLRLSDLVSARRFHATRTWVDLFRPRDVEHQLAVPTGGDLRTIGVGWSLNRTRQDFSDEELDLMRRLQPVLCAVEQPKAWQSHPAATEQPPGLTARELEVLALVADGLTARAIGHRLRIAEATVRKHMEHVYAKTGRRDRLLAAQYARDRGLIARRVMAAAPQSVRRA